MAYEFHADFTLAEAALLLANKERADLEAQGLFRQLRNAAESGELAVTRIPIYRSVGIRRARVGEVAPPLPNVPTGETDWPNSLVDREALAAWCEARGHVPPFLAPQVATGDALHENERRTLLKIVRALAQLHGLKAGALWHKEAAVILSELAKSGIEPPCAQQTLAKHLQAAFKIPL